MSTALKLQEGADYIAPCMPTTVTTEFLVNNGYIPDRNSGFPLFVAVELSYACNLQCAHCYSYSSSSRVQEPTLALNDWKAIFCQYRRAGSIGIQFLGGEPTINPMIHDLLDHSAKIGFSLIEVFSNGYSFNIDVARRVARANGILTISLLSTSESIHDDFSGRRGSFARTLANIERYVHEGVNVHVALITEGSEAANLIETKSLLSSFGVKKVSVSPTVRVGRSKKGVDLQVRQSTCLGCKGSTAFIDSMGRRRSCVFS